MTLLEMRKRVASLINYVDSSGAVLTGKDITSTDIDNWINDRYLEDAFPEYARLRPQFYNQEATVENYAATGTVSASSTGTTLVASSAIFSSNMVDAVVYNSTDGESAKITAYTSSTTVTLDTTIGDDWDGDTIYVFTGIYTFGGDASDIFSIEWVGIKNASTDEDYVECTPVDDEDVFDYRRGRSANDMFISTTPIYIFEAVDVGGVPTSGIKIRPINWTEAISAGVFIRYTEMPASLSADSDSPRIPKGCHKFLVYGAVADAHRKLEQYNEADHFEQLYQYGMRRLMRVHPSARTKRRVNFMSRNRRFIVRR